MASSLSNGNGGGGGVKKKMSIEEKLRESINNIKIDGLPNIFRSELFFFKVMWIFVLIGSTIFCFYLITMSFMDYFKFQVTTNYRLIVERQSTFPTLTICNINPLNSDYYVQLLEEANITEVSDNAYDNLVQLEVYWKAKTGRYFTKEEKSRMSNMDSAMISCNIQYNPCNVTAAFTHFYHPSYLNCLQFNSGYDADGNVIPLQQASLAGSDNSLIFELYTGLPNALASKIYKRGYYLFINNNTDYPYKETPSPIKITPGYGLTVIPIRNFYNQFNQWPYQYSECTVTEENELIKPLADNYLFEQVINTSYSYSRDTCLLFCLQLQTTRVCNCTNYWISFQPEGYDYCFGAKKECADNFYHKEFNVGSYVATNCISKCPLECHKYSFDNFKSYAYYPLPLYVNQTLQISDILTKAYPNETDFTDNLASNAVQITVFYDTLTYTKVEEEPKITWDNLIGTLGGHLHLFLGMSFISLIELIELVVQLIMYVIVTRKNAKAKSALKTVVNIQL